MAKTKRKAVKNYTTGIAVEKTVSEVEALLAKHGAKQIYKEYDENSQVSKLSFAIEYKGEIIPIQMPVRVDPIVKRLNEEVKNRRIEKKYENNKDQARRIAWRIILDWIDSQMTMVELGQREMIEIFLPDIIDLTTKMTLFEKMSEEGGNLLLGFKDGHYRIKQ